MKRDLKREVNKAIERIDDILTDGDENLKNALRIKEEFVKYVPLSVCNLYRSSRINPTPFSQNSNTKLCR